MRVLLLRPIPEYIKEKFILPLGLLSIATYLSNNGHTVKIFDRTVESGSMKKVLDAFDPDIVGISAISSKSFLNAVRKARLAKKRKIPVVLGGPTPSLIPEVILDSGAVDYVVIGEGEITFLELVNALRDKKPVRDIKGLAYMENGKAVFTPEREPADLADLPVIDFRFVDPNKYIVTNVNDKRILHTYASKGCPGNCSFCYNSCFSKGVWRPRPPEYFLAEIRYLLENCAIDGVYFVDDLLSRNSRHLSELCGKIAASGLRFEWGCDMRADRCSEEDLRMMYDAGCRWIFFGIETGSPERQRIIRKNLDLDKAKITIDHCREIGIVATTSFMIGLPDSTEEHIKETIKYAESIHSDVKVLSSFGPIPKTEIYDDLVQNKRLQPKLTYKEWGRMKWFDTFGVNYTKVPTKEIKVITSCFFAAIVTKKHNVRGVKKNTSVKKIVNQVVYIIKRRHLKSLWLLFLGGIEFLHILYYAHMFPKIRRKYGLGRAPEQ